MHIMPFQMERWQSKHEHHVDINLSDSGVHPLRVSELIPDPEERARLLDRPLEYTQTNGTIPLRERIAALYPEATIDNILVTSGGIEANFLAVWNLLNPGDEVVLMTPNYQQIEGLAPAFGARVLRWEMKPDWDKRCWVADLDELRQLVSDKTRLIAICNPNNPTGATFDAAWLDELATIAGDAWVLADEIYAGSEFEGPTTPSMWGRHPRVIVTNSLSKAYGLPGLRLGWIATNADKTTELWKHHDYTTIAPSALSDTLATAALQPERRSWLLGRSRELLKTNLEAVCAWLDQRESSMRYIRPRAGGMMWLAYHDTTNSTELAERFRKEASVLLVPGDQYGMDGWLRIGFGGEIAHVHEGLARIHALWDGTGMR
jgi:aspartate/methionine/tyrosine aminotransferase